jgi:hypothetical protein
VPVLANSVARFSVGRLSDNELILFDESAEESWIIYPPRSRYDFLGDRRPTISSTVVEFHPWAPMAATVDHQLNARDGCLTHSAACPAHAAIQAAVDLGFDPFA